jgi:hypothetical protein
VLKVAPLLLGMLLLELATMSRLSATYDEWAHVGYGKSVLDRRAAGPATRKMAITLLNYLPLHGVVVNVNALVGVVGPAERYRWLREGFRPVAHVGYAWLVYDVERR